MLLRWSWTIGIHSYIYVKIWTKLSGRWSVKGIISPLGQNHLLVVWEYQTGFLCCLLQHLSCSLKILQKLNKTFQHVIQWWGWVLMQSRNNHPTNITSSSSLSYLWQPEVFQAGLQSVFQSTVHLFSILHLKNNHVKPLIHSTNKARKFMWNSLVS